ncbi:MAG: Ppx/GppA phosphatase family protein [Jatrophihabitans sp.]|uniref:Ppx/GppA phosphatase family protein n=1 Tax=Jatrophihabitans sp. TaxID=1932789 RepID=UPI003F80877F
MSSPHRAAGIDCGTNSIRLLVADIRDDGALVDVHREMRVVRLGQGVDRTGRLAPEAIERTRAALVDYAALITELGAPPVRMVATSATRDAANRGAFVAMVRDVLGVDPEVITGTEEAALSFAGAVAGLPGVRGPLLVADIGGGSTELVRGDAAGGAELLAHSMDVGCVRMTERHLHDDPPTAAQVEAVVEDVRSALAAAAKDVPLQDGAALVGVAGTVTTITALALDLPAYDPDRIHGSRISAADVDAVTERLLAMTRAERAALPVMHPGRVDVIGGGALVLRTLVRETGAAEVITSEHDILDGIVLSVLR